MTRGLPARLVLSWYIENKLFLLAMTLTYWTYENVQAVTTATCLGNNLIMLAILARTIAYGFNGTTLSKAQLVCF